MSPATVPKWWRQLALTRADHPAVMTNEGTLTYAQLDACAARMATALLAVGAGKGTRIALIAPDGILWLTTYLACLRIGALLSVLSTLSTPSELAHMLKHSDVQFVIGVRRFLRHNYVEKLAAALPGLEESGPGAIATTAAPFLRAIWLDDAEGVKWADSLTQLLSEADSPQAVPQEILAELEDQVVSTDDAVIVYTSGSTSMPKAVVHTQQTVACHPAEVAKLFLLTSNDRMMPLLPAFWLGGMVMALETLSVGATLVYPGSPENEAVLDAIERFGVNRVNSWGDMLTRLREAAIERGIDVDAIYGLGHFRDTSGELIPPHLQCNPLGMSETFAVHSSEPINTRLPDNKAGASGRTVNGYERRIVNPETGATVAAGDVGELYLRGGGLMSGLYKVPREKVFTQDGFYPTGDLVRVDEDGYLYFVARRGDMIKTRAANVSRLEVEAALRAFAEVELSVVAGLVDPDLGQRVVAAIVLKSGANISEEQLQVALRDTLSSYKIPRNIVFVKDSDIPRTATGKIKLFEVAEMISRQMRHNVTSSEE